MDKEVFMSALANALGVEPSELSETTELNNDNWDSLAHMATIAAIDEKFGVTVPAKELVSVGTVGQLRELLEHIVSTEAEKVP
jgi:acyl carrier protein